MIYVFAALYQEIKPLIDVLNLKKRPDTDTHFKQFENDDILVTLTGVGPVRAALVVGAVLSRELDKGNIDKAFAVNIGSAALIEANADNSSEIPSKEPKDKAKYPTSDIFLINKLINIDSNRVFYPDMIINTSIPEASLITGSRILDFDTDKDYRLSPKNLSDYDLYDMEGAAFYEAANEFLRQDQIHIIKAVSDTGEGNSVKKDDLISIFEKLSPVIIGYIKTLEEICKKSSCKMPSKDYESDPDSDLMERVINDAHFSVTMANEYRQLVKYADLTGADLKGHVKSLYLDGILPAKDKRKGKDILNELRKHI